jgi:hypothetical protein
MWPRTSICDTALSGASCAQVQLAERRRWQSRQRVVDMVA